MPSTDNRRANLYKFKFGWRNFDCKSGRQTLNLNQCWLYIWFEWLDAGVLRQNDKNQFDCIDWTVKAAEHNAEKYYFCQGARSQSQGKSNEDSSGSYSNSPRVQSQKQQVWSFSFQNNLKHVLMYRVQKQKMRVRFGHSLWPGSDPGLVKKATKRSPKSQSIRNVI